MSEELDILTDEQEPTTPPVVDEVDVQVVDDTPPEDRRPPREGEAAKDDDDDFKELGQRAQKRINRLRYDFHEERRLKEAAERQREEAIRWAKSVHSQMQQLQTQALAGQRMGYDSTIGRYDAELQNAKTALRSAHESGDAEKIADASEKIAAIAAQKQAVISTYRPPSDEEIQRAQVPVPQPEPPPDNTARIPAQLEATLQQRLIDWAAANPWINTDQQMAQHAMAMHKVAVEEELVPRSKAYFKFIDQQMVAAFPEKFGHAKPEPKVAAKPTVVAPAVRSNGQAGKRTVKLPQSAAETAKRLGVPLAEYVRYYEQETQDNG